MVLRWRAVGGCSWGLYDPQNALRFRPVALNHMVSHKALKKAVWFSIRSFQSLLSAIFMAHALCEASLEEKVIARSIVRHVGRLHQGVRL